MRISGKSNDTATAAVISRGGRDPGGFWVPQQVQSLLHPRQQVVVLGDRRIDTVHR